MESWAWTATAPASTMKSESSIGARNTGKRRTADGMTTLNVGASVPLVQGAARTVVSEDEGRDDIESDERQSDMLQTSEDARAHTKPSLEFFVHR